MNLARGATLAFACVICSPAKIAYSAERLDYANAVRHTVVEDCTKLLTGIWSLNDQLELESRGFIKASDEEEKKRANSGRVPPEMAMRQFDDAMIGIRLDPGLSCMVVFDGPTRIETRDALFEYFDSPISGFQRVETKKSLSKFEEERSYAWKFKNGVSMRYDIGTTPSKDSERGSVNVVIWMPWIN